MPNQYRTIPPTERFWRKVEFTDSCWLWLAGSMGGYGRFWDGKRKVGAHRWAYEFCVGPIPAGLTIDHLCRTQLCVNPDHLEAVTERVNILRGTSPTAINARKAHCSRGHLFDVAIKNGRGCRRCNTIKNRLWRQLKAG